jgi:hypothetical protein
VRFPSLVKVVSIEEATEALLLVEASVPSQPRVQRTPDYDQSVLVRVWRWEEEARPFDPEADPCAPGGPPPTGEGGGTEGTPPRSGGWVLPDQQLRHQFDLRKQLEDAIRRAPVEPRSISRWLEGINRNERASLQKDKRLSQLLALARASAEYWSGDMGLAVQHALEAAPEQASPAEARRALTLALRALTISGVTRREVAERALELLENASNDDFVLAFAAYTAVVEQPPPPTRYEGLLELLESPLSRARLRGIEALGAWYQEDLPRAKELYLLALEKLQSLPQDLRQTLQADIAELGFWWKRCIQLLVESLDKRFGWSELQPPLFEAAKSDAPPRDMGAVAHAELAALRSLQASRERNEGFDTELTRLKHLALESGLYPLLFNASLYELRFALDWEDVDRLLSVMLNLTITSKEQEEEARRLLLQKDPSERTVRALLTESARRLARRPQPQELATAALHLLSYLVPYASREEREVIMEAAERALLRAPPKLNVVLDMRTPAFLLLKRLTEFADAPISSWVLNVLTVHAFTQLERMAAPEVEAPDDAGFASTYLSERKRELAQFDYRDPSQLADFLEELLGRVPEQVRLLWGGDVLHRVLKNLEQFQTVLSLPQVAMYESRLIVANAIRWASPEQVNRLWQRLFAEHLREDHLPPAEWSHEQAQHPLMLCAALFAQRPGAVPEGPREQVFEYLLGGLRQRRRGMGRQDADVLLYQWCKHLGEAHRLRGVDAYLSLFLEERSTQMLANVALLRAGFHVAELLRTVSRASELSKRFSRELPSVISALLEPQRYQTPNPFDLRDTLQMEYMLACLYSALVRGRLHSEPVPPVAERLTQRALGLWGTADERQAWHGLRMLGELAPVLPAPLRRRAVLTVHAEAAGRHSVLRSRALAIIASWSDWLQEEPLHEELIEAVALAAESPRPQIRFRAAWATAKLGWATRLAGVRQKLEHDRNHLVRAQFARAQMEPDADG